MKALVKLVEDFGRDPRFNVYSVDENGKELFVNTFSFRYDAVDGLWAKELNLIQAMECARRIENSETINKETVIYRTE